jgi:hypothetical protein
MDGYNTGLLNVPEARIREFNSAFYDDTEHDRALFVIELRRNGVGSLVLDVDYTKLNPTRNQSRIFGAFLCGKPHGQVAVVLPTELLLEKCVDDFHV